MKKYCYGICFLISVAINILFSIHLYVGDGPNQEISCRSSLTWSEKAAAEAEAVAATSCSSHGRAFLDGSISDGQPVCECYGCYSGTDCSELSPGCAADANSGDPIYLEPFWMQNAADTAVVISGWHRMSYEYADDPMMSPELDKYIRKLHSVAGNAITQDRYIVFGVGSSQLLSAAVYALSSQNSSSPSNVLASTPCTRIKQAYAWVRCERQEDNDCAAVLKAGKIIGQSGSTFSAKDRYARLSLIKSQDDFELLMQRLTELVSLENHNIEIM
ncbi:putative alliinase, EGF-like domain, pyridoxal phosphate-dependent transferase domain 1 [Helianthus annuus]|nr:putative alliinase, EGF-like domain, pyridoxal phosphate-dependent transferase domain 1 [Helianthus annuus]KAJ0516214.1 putative alliinase, EGF-like domain, pyridoxal phosphate-dependent transferase, small [Helianthus annuus]